MAGELILVVDDEENILQLIGMYLERDGFRVLTAQDGRTALQLTQDRRPGLMVLDVMLPEVDGFEVCRRLRTAGNPLPIIMLTARDEDIDKILGLEIGADDYLTKPFNPRELVARVRAIFRRESLTGSQPDPPLQLSDLSIDPARREVHVGESPIELRTKEFDLLLALAQHQGLVLSRDQLLNLAWGYDFYGQTRTVDVHVAQLRKKLSGSAVQIQTVTGVGYKLVG